MQLQAILQHLVAFPSITPKDAGCQDFMLEFLSSLGFTCYRLDNKPVANFFAYYGANKGPLLVYAGHTDVVAVGDETKWHSDPFILTNKQGMLYGRGVADMKGSLACMLAMAKRFVTTYPDCKGQLGFLITSGEEGNDYNLGTPYVMEQLQAKGIVIDYCVVGEPSSTNSVGDIIKIGRRGSLNATLSIQGKQGHVAYPHLAKNPIHLFSPLLYELTTTEWDKGNAYFPPTSMQITYINSGGEATNIIPGELILHLNFRYSTEQTQKTLTKRLLAIFSRHSIEPVIEWRLSGKPFLTNKGLLLTSCTRAITEQTGKTPKLSTSGGTSDGRFIAPYGVQVVELGPSNATIHQVNECVALKDLEQLEAIYFSICEKLLG